MVEVAVLVDRVEGARLSDKASENSQPNYKLNVSLSEKDRTGDALVLNFVLELTGQPQVSRIIVQGTATIRGSKEEVQEELSTPEGNGPPKVLVIIYERVYGMIYLVAGTLMVPRPLPNLVKTA